MAAGAGAGAELARSNLGSCSGEVLMRRLGGHQHPEPLGLSRQAPQSLHMSAGSEAGIRQTVLLGPVFPRPIALRAC